MVVLCEYLKNFVGYSSTKWDHISARNSKCVENEKLQNDIVVLCVLNSVWYIYIYILLLNTTKWGEHER